MQSSNQTPKQSDDLWLRDMLWYIRPETSGPLQETIDKLIMQANEQGENPRLLRVELHNVLSALNNPQAKTKSQVVAGDEGADADITEESILGLVQSIPLLTKTTTTQQTQQKEVDWRQVAHAKKVRWLLGKTNAENKQQNPLMIRMGRFLRSLVQCCTSSAKKTAAKEDNDAHLERLLTSTDDDALSIDQKVYAKLSEARLKTLSASNIQLALDNVIADPLEVPTIKGSKGLGAKDSKRLQQILSQRIIDTEKKKINILSRSKKRHRENIKVVEALQAVDHPTIGDLKLLARIAAYQESSSKGLDISPLAFTLAAKDKIRDTPDDKFLDQAGYRDAMTVNRSMMATFLDESCAQTPIDGTASPQMNVSDFSRSGTLANSTLTVGLNNTSESDAAQFTDKKMMLMLELGVEQQHLMTTTKPLSATTKCIIVDSMLELEASGIGQSTEQLLDSVNAKLLKDNAEITPVQLDMVLQEIEKHKATIEKPQISGDTVSPLVRIREGFVAKIDDPEPQQLVCGQISCDEHGEPTVKIAVDAAGFRTCCVSLYDTSNLQKQGSDRMEAVITKIEEESMDSRKWLGESLEGCMKKNKLALATEHAGGVKLLFESIVDGQINTTNEDGQAQLNGDLKLDNILVNPASGKTVVIDNDYEANEVPVDLDQGMLIDVSAPTFGPVYFEDPVSATKGGLLKTALLVRQEPSEIALDPQKETEKQMNEQLEKWLEEPDFAEKIEHGLMLQRLWLGPTQTMHDVYALCTVGQTLANDCLLREPQDQKARTLLEGCQREQRNMLEALAQVTTVDDRLSPQQRLAMVTTILQKANIQMRSGNMSNDRAVSAVIKALQDDDDIRADFVKEINRTLEASGTGPETDVTTTTVESSALNDENCVGYLDNLVNAQQQIDKFNQTYTVDQLKDKLQAPTTSANRRNRLDGFERDAGKLKSSAINTLNRKGRLGKHPDDNQVPSGQSNPTRQ